MSADDAQVLLLSPCLRWTYFLAECKLYMNAENTIPTTKSRVKSRVNSFGLNNNLCKSPSSGKLASFSKHGLGMQA